MLGRTERAVVGAAADALRGAPSAVALLVLVASLAACAGSAPRVADLDGVVREPFAPAPARANVLLFVTVDCPIANAYSPEIGAIVADHARDEIAFWLVHVDPDVTPERARAHVREYGIACGVLLDPAHQLVRRAGVTITPEAVVVTRDGEVAYRGRIDNAYGGLGARRAEVSRRDLREAIAAVLAGRPPDPARTEAIGCLIPELPAARRKPVAER